MHLHLAHTLNIIAIISIALGKIVKRRSKKKKTATTTLLKRNSQWFRRERYSAHKIV